MDCKELNGAERKWCILRCSPIQDPTFHTPLLVIYPTTQPSKMSEQKEAKAKVKGWQIIYCVKLKEEEKSRHTKKKSFFFCF